MSDPTLVAHTLPGYVPSVGTPPRHKEGERHGLTRRLDDHARAARIAMALGDDLTVVGED
ncbi:hypothetical protein ABZ835_36595 [Streptomyces sp. NPDC047461]|uniref:hypothetical protein n=1 Tax=Streptomyces sp. NPDC047461 TaxID=3155619 RepID=UPI0033F76C07